jgi:tRNA nucleotidyltransferase (CCA-adding enzyme)
MKEKILEVLNILENNGYESYIVGGYVRDYLLGTKSSDIDIATSATPKELLTIFDQITSTNDKYGSVSIIYKNIKYDITTFRKEIKYEGNRNPIKIKYIKDIKKDLLRRDFTINTFCMNKKGEVLDILEVKKDLDNKIIKTVGNPRYRLKEDALRILRAIRFATLLDFNIEKKTKYYIKKYAYLLKKLSSTRKKEELDKIFSSKSKEKGRELLLTLHLDKYLNLNNLKNIVMCDDIIGIWAQLDCNDIYPFTKIETSQINQIKELLTEKEITNYHLYHYGLYISTVVAQIKHLDITNINELYTNLPIKSKDEINIKGNTIANILNKQPGSYIKDIMKDIELQILNQNLPNTETDITNYIKNNYLEK